MHKLSVLVLIAAFLSLVSCRNKCKNVVCENSGNCVEGVCQCPDGFSGDNCEIENCTNGIQDQGEEGIDCGGDCDNVCKLTTALEVFNTSNSSMVTNSVSDVVKTNDGSIWVGTSNGLDHYSNGTWTHYSTWNSVLPEMEIRDLYVAKNGDVWVGTWGGFAVRIKNNILETFSNYPPSVQGTFSSFTEDASENIWLTDNIDQLVKYDGASWSYVDTSNSAYYVSSFSCVAIDANGVFWTGSNYDGLFSLNGTALENYDASNSALESNVITSIIIGADGTKFIGTGEGLCVVSPSSTWRVFTELNSELSFDYATVLYLDNENRLWIDGSLISYLKNNEIIKLDYEQIDFGTREPFPFFARGVAIDNDGYIWMGTSGEGIVKFKLLQ